MNPLELQVLFIVSGMLVKQENPSRIDAGKKSIGGQTSGRP